MRAAGCWVAALSIGVGAGAPRGALAQGAPAPASVPAHPPAPTPDEDLPPTPPSATPPIAAPAPAPYPEAAGPYHPRRREIEIVIPGERSIRNKVVLGSVAGAAVAIGAVGLYYHLDARSAERDLGPNRFTGTPWSQRHVELVARAEASWLRAGIFYGAGGAVLLGATIAFVATHPKAETSVIRTTRATPLLAPAPGGAVLGGAWRF